MARAPQQAKESAGDRTLHVAPGIEQVEPDQDLIHQDPLLVPDLFNAL